MSLWTTKTGEIVKTSDMETSHIENCLLMLRQGRFSHAWTLKHGEMWEFLFTKELERRKRTIGG